MQHARKDLTIGDWQLDPIHGGMFSMDGGAVFGVVPKSVWKRVCPVDDDNMAEFSCNCLLARNGKNTVLIDTGYGDKYPPLDRKACRMEAGNPCLESLARYDLGPEDIDTVLFTHLHFDHTGAATFRMQDRRLRPTFAGARHLVSAWEWEDAVEPKPELAAAYPQDDLVPLREAGLVETFHADGPLLPGLTTIRTGGHTRGHTAFLFESSDGGEGALFIGDLCATSLHMRMNWNMSYDMFLLATRRKKRELLEKAVEKRWWVIYPHDPVVWAARLEKDPKREFVHTDTVTNVTENRFLDLDELPR